MGLYEASVDPDLNTTIDGQPIFVWKRNTALQMRDNMQRLLSLMKRNQPMVCITDRAAAAMDGVTDAWGWADQSAKYLYEQYGGGILAFGSPGTMVLGQPLELPPNVTLLGTGPGGNCIKLKDNANCDVIQSKDFQSLTGTGKITAEGAPSWFGLMGLRIDGNKANNTAGNGVNFYGARHRIHDVLIENAPGVGFHSEYSGRSYRNSWRDQEESRIDTLIVAESGGIGIEFLGSHNTSMGEVLSGFNGDWGFYSATDTSSPVKYDGNVTHVAQLHTYANGRAATPASDRGAYIGSISNFDTLVTDGDNPTIAASGCRIGYLKAFNAGGERDGVEITGNNTVISALRADAWSGSSGRTIIKNIGNDTHIGSLTLDGEGHNNDGLDLSGVNAVIAALKIKGFSAPGKTGLKLSGSGHRLAGRIVECDTCFNYVSGSRNAVDLTLYAATGQTPTSGIRPGATDKFHILAQRQGLSDLATDFKGITSAFAIDALVEHTITVTHGLLYTPLRYEIMARLDGATDRGFDYVIDLDDVTATTLVFKVKITSASSVGGANAKLCVWAQIG